MNVEELLGFFDPQLCICDMNAKTKDEFFDEIVDLVVPEQDSTNRKVILEMLKNREALGSTAVGNGIAFPHGRSLAVSRLMAIFARSKTGLPCDSLDNKPTHLFFVLLAPPQDRSNQYLPALGKIIETVRKDDLREKLMKVSNFDEFASVLREGETS